VHEALEAVLRRQLRGRVDLGDRFGLEAARIGLVEYGASSLRRAIPARRRSAARDRGR
jgi:hypothetical protein